MAVGPDVLEKNDEQKLIALETQIDKLLMGGHTDYLDRALITAPKGLTGPLFKKLRVRYLRAGWSEVKWSSDQFDGDSLHFFVNSTAEQVDSYYRH